MQRNQCRMVLNLLGILTLVLLVTGMACQLTSPRPASWAGTPTAQAQDETSTVVALTQQVESEEEILLTPTETPPVLVESTATPQPLLDSEGPWLVYPAPNSGGLHAYDLSAKRILEIPLPDPVYAGDLIHGRSPDGQTLIVRAGSPNNTDELALYQIELPSAQAVKLTPLLSLPVQRQIVNQEGTLAMTAFHAVTRPDGLAWSPDGRFLAFSAALDSQTSDLYVLDTLNDRINRVNGLFSQNASPLWSPGSNWLVSQELGEFDEEHGWHADIVTGLRAPVFDQQKTLYMASIDSQGEVFVGWINAQNFISFSDTSQGPHTLRQVNVENGREVILFPSLFDQAALDPISRSLAFSMGYDKAAAHGMEGGIYLLPPDSADFKLQRAGEWKQFWWDPGGMFVASGSQGVYSFTGEGEGLFFPRREGLNLSPQGDWMIAWLGGDHSESGAWLYLPASDHPLQRLIETGVETVFWQPDSQGFIIQSNGGIYHLVFPRLDPIEIETGFPDKILLDFAWLE